MNFGHRNYDVVIREPLFKKCFHPYATLHRNIDCKWYIDGKCTYTEKDGKNIGIVFDINTIYCGNGKCNYNKNIAKYRL